MTSTSDGQADEAGRLAELRRYGVLDTSPEEPFDRLTRLVAKVLDVPIALVSLVDLDRQWFKSRVGLDATETPRDISFCAHAIAGDELFVVPDATADSRFADNPLVLGDPSIRFYAGAPLRTRTGQRIGTLCAIDRQPRELDDDAASVLVQLAEIVIDELELRLANRELVERQHELTAARDEARQAVAAQSQLLTRVSHELRTPIHAISGLCELAADMTTDPRLSEMADTVHGAAAGLSALVDDLLQLGQAGGGQLVVRSSACALADVIEATCRTMRPLAARKGLTLSTVIATELPHLVIIDGVRIRQVVSNLVANAIKFTELGGVTVDVSVPADGLVHISVDDTGVGIADEDLDRVLRPFERACPDTVEGVGLGLSITASVIAAMGGRLELRSRPGTGTTVIVELPAAAADDGRLPGSRPTPDEQSGRGTVLVVEDNAVNRLLVSRQLDRLGFEAALVADGYEALDAVERHRPDIVLMDWRMPGIDGTETARRIRRHERQRGLPRTPIIAVTASAMPGDREQLIGAGMDDVLHKPVGQDVLAAALDRWASRSAAEHPDGSAAPDEGRTEVDRVSRALDDLARDLGDRSTVVAVVRTYLDELPDRVAAILEQEGDARSRAAHALRSSSLVVGGNRLARLCADLESLPAGPDATRLLDVARHTARLLEAWIEG